MKVILNTEIVGLGEEGDIVTVSDGYARNYLLPTKRVLVYNSQNKATLESQYKAIEKRRAERRLTHMGLKERLDVLTHTIKMKCGDSGHLYGAVTSTIIAEELETLGISLFKKQIVVPHHTIKEIGESIIEVKLSAGITAHFKLIVEGIFDGKRITSVAAPVAEETADEAANEDAMSAEASDIASTTDVHTEEITTEVAETGEATNTETASESAETEQTE